MDQSIVKNTGTNPRERTLPLREGVPLPGGAPGGATFR